MARKNNNPALTYTLDDYINMQISDDMTYYNFSIIEVVNGVEHLDKNLIEIYIDELKSQCTYVTLSEEEYNKYKYNPDLLAYDVYGSIQLDFVILLLNDIYDPKEFTKRKLLLPHSSILSKFLSDVYSKESKYIEQNRIDNNILL